MPAVRCPPVETGRSSPRNCDVRSMEHHVAKQAGSREGALNFGEIGGAGDENRTRTVSLGIWQIRSVDTNFRHPLRLSGRLAVGHRWSPLCTGDWHANGTPMSGLTRPRIRDRGAAPVTLLIDGPYPGSHRPGTMRTTSSGPALTVRRQEPSESRQVMMSADSKLCAGASATVSSSSHSKTLKVAPWA